MHLLLHAPANVSQGHRCGSAKWAIIADGSICGLPHFGPGILINRIWIKAPAALSEAPAKNEARTTFATWQLRF